MATPDHTALVRPPNPSRGNTTHSPGRPFASRDAVGATRTHVLIRLAAVSLAINKLISLIADSEVVQGAQAFGMAVDCGAWPLTPASKERLVSAIGFPNPYAETLRHEQRVVF